MSPELVEAQITDIKKDISELKEEVRKLPAQITNSLSENIDLKIQLKIKEAETKYMGALITLGIGVLGELIGLVVSFIMK